MFVPFTRGCSSSEELYGTLSTLGDVRLPAGAVGPGRSVYRREAPLFRRLVNRNNCVQKLRGTLIVTWQANRIDTPRSLSVPSLSPAPGSPRPRSFGPLVIIRSLSDGFDPRNTCTPVSRSCSGRMHRARNELPRLVNYAPSLPIGNNVPRGLLIAGRIISMPRRVGILPLPWTLY